MHTIGTRGRKVNKNATGTLSEEEQCACGKVRRECNALRWYFTTTPHGILALVPYFVRRIATLSVVNAVEVREINSAPDIEHDENGEVVFERHDGVPLSPIEIAFVEHYCGDANFSAAKAFARAKGKAKDNNSIGAIWLTKPHIQKAIHWRLQSLGATRDVAIASLTRIANADWNEMVDVKVAGDEIVAVKMDLMPIVRANEIILRAHGALDNKQNLTVPIQININTNIPEEDLA